MFLKIDLRKSSSVIAVPTNWELMAFQTRNSAPPRELQSTESERSKLLSRRKDRSKKCKQSQNGIQEKHSDHKQSKSSTKQFVLRVEEDGEDSLL